MGLCTLGARRYLFINGVRAMWQLRAFESFRQVVALAAEYPLLSPPLENFLSESWDPVTFDRYKHEFEAEVFKQIRLPRTVITKVITFDAVDQFRASM